MDGITDSMDMLLLQLQSCPTLCDPIDSSPPGSPTMDMSLSKLGEIVEDREVWSAAVHGVTKSRKTIKTIKTT